MFLRFTQATGCDLVRLEDSGWTRHISEKALIKTRIIAEIRSMLS